jgi:hypothetical protein
MDRYHRMAARDEARKVRDERRQGPRMEPVFSETEGDLFSHERVWVDGTELPVDSTQWVYPPYGVLIWLERTAYSSTFNPPTDETHRFELENTEEPFFGEVNIQYSVTDGTLCLLVQPEDDQVQPEGEQ